MIKENIIKTINKYFFLLIINLALFFLLTSCSGDGCVDSDDFGDQESQTLKIYSNTNQTSCDFDPGLPDTDQPSEVIKACLIANSKSIVDRNGVTFNSSTGCKGFTDAELNRLCKDKCVSDCQINSTSLGAQPSWVSNTALLSDSGSGVNIPKNSEITITAKGNLVLGNDISLPPSVINFAEMMPHSYSSSSFSTPSIIDVNKGQSINLKFSKASTSSVNSPTQIDDYNFARRLVAYIIPHPQNYDYKLSDPANGHLFVPLTPRFNGWKCSYTSIDNLQSECSFGSKEIDAYNDDANSISLNDIYSAKDGTVFRVNNALSSANFNVGSDAKKLIDYGGFIRWKDDPFKNYNFDPFATTSCSITGICSESFDSTDGIIVGYLSNGFSYVNNDSYSKEASFKQLTSFCPNLNFSELAVYDQLNRKIYFINDFTTNSSYSSNKIPLYAGYKITLTANSTNATGSTTNCGKFLAMRMLKYNDITINRSGFVSFRIVDNDSNQSSQNPTCTLSARIINPNGDHPLINDSINSVTNPIFKLNNGSLSLQMPAGGLIVDVLTALSGTITLDSLGTNYVTSTSECFEDIRQQIKDRYNQCIASNTNPCILNTSTASFSSFANCSSNGNGQSGQESTTSNGGGSGGGGGGNSNGIATLNSTSSSGIAGTSGTSFYNDFFHNSTPSISSPSSLISGYKGIGGINGSNGQVKIYNCATGESCSPTIFNYDPAVQYQTYNVPASGTFRYEIYGGGGGGGGSNCGSSSITAGGDGASGTVLSGELKNINATKTPTLRIYIGAGGPSGYSSCSANYSNVVSYSNSLSLETNSANKLSKINFASYGFPVISTRNLTSSSATHNFTINPYCHSDASKVVAVDNCVGLTTCSIALTNSTFNSLVNSNCNANGNGDNAPSNTSADNNGSGGGGGGGNGSNGTSASATGTIASGVKGSSTDASAGTSGDSYYDTGYHSSAPSVASANNVNSNGSATLTPSGGSATSVTSVGSTSYTVPAGTTSLSYVIKGAGGGNGGNASVTRAGGTGASGTQLSGSISVSAGDVIDVHIGEKGYDGAAVCSFFSNVIFEGSSVNLSTHISARSPMYGTPQRTSLTSYTSNTYCNSSTASTNFNSNLSNTNYLVNDTNLGTPQNTGISPAENCQNGQGSSASSSASLSNAGGGGGAGGGNGGTSTSGIINAGAVAGSTQGGAGSSGESFYQPYYHNTAPASATTATNQANASQSASDGIAVLKQTSSSGASLKNLTSATSDSYTVTADGTIYYELTGAGGGKGGKNSNTQSTAPGNGAGGAKISGTLNVKTDDVISIYVGKAGTNGQNCGTITNYFNTSEFTQLSISGLGCSIATINFANYGTPTTSTTPYTANASCSSGSLTSNSNITPCIGNTSCSIYATNGTFGSDPCAPSSGNQFAANGSNYTDNSAGGAGGGGGGGGGSYQTTTGGSANVNQNSEAGSTGPSFWNTTYISSAPTVTAGGGGGGQNGLGYAHGARNGSAGGNGSIKICNTDTTTNCSTNSTPGVYEVTIPSGGFYFEISGGGGGGGSPNISARDPQGGSGATGSKLTGTASLNLTANDKIYIYVGGGGGGGSASIHSASGGAKDSSSLYFLGGNGGSRSAFYKGVGGAGGSASFIVYKGNVVALASGGGGGGGGGEAESDYNYSNGNSASSSTTLNSGSSSSFFTYTLKTLAIQASCATATSSKGIGGAISASNNILKGGDGSETISDSSCSGGGGGGGGGASALLINDETVAIAGGGGGGGGNNSTTAGTNATANTNLRNYLKVVPDKKYLVFSAVDVASVTLAPTKSTSDTKLLGGTGGAINSSSDSYCSTNSNGQGGDGGGGTMLAIGNRVIAIAGGGGGGGGASINGSASATRNASNSNNILDKLKAGPFGPYLAISAEYRGGTAGYVNSSQISNGSNLIVNAPASAYFNDVAFASYGDNFTTPFLYASSCSNETNLSTLLQTNCLEKNTCTSAISNALGGGQTCSIPANYKALAKLTYQSSLQGFASAPTSTAILTGGNGGKNGLRECSGGGGAGGGATAISVASHSDYSDAQEQFIAIAGGGGGGGGASCSGAVSSSANAENTNTAINGLNNKALGTWISARVSFPRPAVRNVPEDYYEYDDFAINDSLSADPLKSLVVNSSAFSPFSGNTLVSNKVFVRKGQVIRFSPNSWQSNWSTKNGLSRQCGVGMVVQVEPRPAIICLGSKSEKIINPNCIPDFNLESNSSTPLGCKDQSSVCNGVYNAGTGKYNSVCNGICQKKISCSTLASEANNFTKSGCSLTSSYVVSEQSVSCNLENDSDLSKQNTTSACNNCNNARLAAAQLPFYLTGNFDQCFDLENYTGKIQNIVNNQANQSIINSYIADKKLSYLKSFNGEYGNFENYRKISDNNYELKSPVNSSLKGRLRFFIADGHDLNIPSLNTITYSNPYSNNSGTATINSSVSLSARNGQWLQIKLCKEDNQTSRNCRSLNIDSSKDLSTANKSQSAILDISSSSPLSYSSINYKFNTDGVLYRDTDPISGKDCNATNANISGVASGVSNIFSPSASVVTTKDSKFYCHTDNTDSKLLRLSFKIFDPEIENCNTSTGATSGTFNGILVKNNYYNSNTPANTSAVCSNSELASKNCEKEFICIDKYGNNTGTYEVKIKVKKNLGATQLINSIIQPVLFWLDGNPNSAKENERIGFAEYIYKSLITNVIYVTILKLTMVLAIMFYGMGYLMGVSELNQTQIIIRVFKIAFIYLFVGETGWQWFKAIFVNFYKDGVAQAVFLMTSAFNEAPEIKQALDTGNFSNKAILFSGADQVITILFSSAIHKKIWAFLFTGIFGWSYILIFYFSLLNFIFALANSILLFLTAQVMISLLFIMGPLFFIFLLFSQTKDMFDNWLKAMTGFGLQQIFLLTTLAFFNMLFIEVLKMSLGYGVCWDDAWVINLGVRFTITKFWVISSLPPRISMSDDLMETGNPESIPSLFSILYIWVVASLMKKMVTLMTDVASTISDGIKASEIGQGIAAIGSKIKSAGASAASSAVSAMTSRIDDKLFDSGSLAKQKRNAREQQAKSDMASRKELLAAADEAEKKYKADPNNIAKLGDMSKEEQDNEIRRVRSEAMDKKADELDIRGDDKKRIMSGKGLKYQGNNVFGALYQAGKQGLFTGGSLKTSLIERENKATKLGNDEAMKAAEAMNSKQADKFAKDVEDGKINVSRTTLGKIMKNKKRIAAAVLTGGLSELSRKIGKAITDKVSHSQYGEFRKLAVDQLEKEGKISKTGSLKMETRNSEEQQMIRDRMRSIKSEKKDKGKKDVSKKIASQSSRSIKKRFNNKKRNLQKAMARALGDNDIERFNKLSEIDDAINDAENMNEDDENYNNANDLIDDFNNTDFDKNESVDELMSRDSYKNFKEKE